MARASAILLSISVSVGAATAASAQAVEISPFWRVEATQRVRPPAASSYIPSAQVAPRQLPPPPTGADRAPAVSQTRAATDAEHEPLPAFYRPLDGKAEQPPLPTFTASEAPRVGAGKANEPAGVDLTRVVAQSRRRAPAAGHLDFLFENPAR